MQTQTFFRIELGFSFFLLTSADIKAASILDINFIPEESKDCVHLYFVFLFGLLKHTLLSKYFILCTEIEIIDRR